MRIKLGINFKSHFCTGVKEYKQLQAPSVDDSLYSNQANLIQNLRDDIHNVIVEEIHKHVANLSTQTTSYPTEYYQPDPHSLPDYYDPSSFETSSMNDQIDHMANSLAEYRKLVPQLVTQVKQLQKTVQDLKRNPPGPPSQITSDTSTLTQSAISNRSNKWTFKPPFHLYCYTHGLCAHTGQQCNDPNDRHKPNATFFDRKGGSNRNCDRAK